MIQGHNKNPHYIIMRWWSEKLCSLSQWCVLIMLCLIMRTVTGLSLSKNLCDIFLWFLIYLFFFLYLFEDVCMFQILWGRLQVSVSARGPINPKGQNVCVCVSFLQVVFPCIWITHFALRPISLELNGRTRTATFTDAPAIFQLRPPPEDSQWESTV